MDRFLKETFKLSMNILILAAVISIGIALMIVGWVLLGVKSIWSLVIREFCYVKRINKKSVEGTIFDFLGLL